MTMLEYDFMRNAFAAATIVAIVSGLVGYFLVLRGQTFAGHALSHVGFTGATGAVLLGVAPLWGLVALTVTAGIGMGAMGERLAQRDVAIGMILALSLGFGLLFLHFFTASATQATALLVGNVLFASLQPELAEAKGVSLRLYSVLFLAIVGLATAECVQIVGVLLVFALMVGPAATAQRLSSAVATGLLLAAALALLEAWAGIALAFYTDWPASFCITALSAGFYLLTTVPRPRL
jgi:zinc/manganese transport system permease protein